MKKLAPCLAFLVFAPGCIIVTDSGSSSGNFDVSWSLLSSADDSVVGCPPDGTTAEVVSVLSGSSCPGPDCFVDLFDCPDGGGLTADLPLGDYDVNVNIKNDAGDLIAQSALGNASLVADGDVVGVDFDFYVDGGFLQAAWVLQDSGSDVSCSDVPDQNGVGVLSTYVSDSTAYDDKFDCEGDDSCGPQCGTTAPLPIGDYEVVVDLLGPNDGQLAACGDQMSRTIDTGNELVDLGTVTCDVTGLTN